MNEQLTDMSGAPQSGRLLLPLLAAAVGLFSAAVLSAGHLLDLPVPCGGSRGCASVAAHPSSKLAGIPIAYFGFVAYTVLIGLLGRPVVGRKAVRAAVMIAGVGTVISATLLIYSQLVIRATCPWCVVSGAAMMTVFGLTVWQWRRPEPLTGPRPAMLWTILLLAALGVGLQAGRMTRAASEPPIPSARLAQVGVARLLEPPKTLGPTDAVVTVIVFADFWCPGCRSALNSLFNYQRTHPHDVRIVYRHLPLWGLRGHETSRAAAALSEVAAEQGRFWDFVHWVHGQRRQPDQAAYFAAMEALGFDPAVVERRLDDSADPAVARVLHDEALAEELGVTATPTFVLQVGPHAPVSATQRSLPRWLNSPGVTELLAERARARAD